MSYDITKLSESLKSQILDLPDRLTSKTVITVLCDCGTETQLSFRSFWRKWLDMDQYLCKSCHVKTYNSNPERIEKFRRSFAKTTKTAKHKALCSANGKKVWGDPELRRRITEAVRCDNKTNPKKKTARKKALIALKAKSWFQGHMDSMRTLANDQTRSNIKEFITKATIVHDAKYDYSEVDYVNNTTEVTIICPTHGEFRQIPHNHLQGKGCAKCKVIISNPHQLVLDMIPDHITVENNVRTVIPPKELDIWLPNYTLGIEINGEYWHGVRSDMSNMQKRIQKYKHRDKANDAVAVGIRLLQFWATEIDQKSDIVKSMIMHAIGGSRRVYARKCLIQKPDLRNFFTSSHLQGHRSASVRYALVESGEIVCGISFCKHRQYEWEIARYACKPGMAVVGGFSRLFKRFIDEYKPRSILTFSDRRISQGSLYSKYFELDGVTAPNYFYFGQNTILPRQYCQKHKLPALLENFDKNRTESENMLCNGYVQVFDCGHLRFIWQN